MIYMEIKFKCDKCNLKRKSTNIKNYENILYTVP